MFIRHVLSCKYLGSYWLLLSFYIFTLQPFDHKKSLAKFYYADEKVLHKAIKVSLEARDKWDKTPLKERTKIFLKAADLISTK